MIAELILATMAVTVTDQTVNVAKGTKLDVNNFAGDVKVKAWDRDAVRVEVTHSDREIVDIKPGDQTLSIRSRSVRGGPPRSLDYTITVPAWMGINVNGTYADVLLEGVGGDVTIDTNRGDIAVKGGSGFVSLKSVQGEISLEKAKGRIEVRAVNESIRLADISGDLSAESTNGSIILDRIDSANVDLYTVNGNISYDGPVKDKGLYRLTTHNGLIAMAIPERVNAVLTVRTYNGSFRSTFPVKTDDQNTRKRFTVTLGNGSAHLELESFGGTISLRRPGEPRPETERRRREREKEKEHGDHIPALADLDLHIDASVEQALANVDVDVAASVEQAMAQVDWSDVGRAVAGAFADVDWNVPHIWPVPTPHPVPTPRPRARR
jgi:putative adhesin